MKNIILTYADYTNRKSFEILHNLRFVQIASHWKFRMTCGL